MLGMPPKRPKTPALPTMPAGERWEFTILSPPRTKKNHQKIIVNKRTGRPMVIGSDGARQWEADTVGQLKSQWHRDGGLAQPVELSATVYRERRTGDLGNYLAAVCDALEKSGIVVNDRWIASFDGSRLACDPDDPRVVLYLTTMQP